MQVNKIVLAGGSGFLGQIIADYFAAKGSSVIILSRNTFSLSSNIRYVKWDGKTAGSWVGELNDCDVLINLTGKSVDCRYTEKNKAEILRSRVDATKVLGSVVRQLNTPPKVWLNAASATIYPYSEDVYMDEYKNSIGEGFSVEVCKAWEKTFNEIALPSTRKIILRISMVLGKNGGVVPVLSKLTKAGLGGKMGTGKQFISWMHEKDFLNAIVHLINNENSQGIYNLAAPQPVTNSYFMQQMRNITGVKIGLPAKEWMLEVGAFFLRTETELVLKSRKVISKRLSEEGFVFQYPDVNTALRNLLN